MSDKQNNDHRLDREWALVRLRQAIECAEKIKTAANWAWVHQKADQLIEAAKVLMNMVE